MALSWSVTNTGGSSRSFGVGAEIRQGSAVLADLGGQTTPTIAAGTTASGSFGYLIPTWWSGGIRVARAAVWTGTAGSSTWLNNFDRDFTVEQVTLGTQGRVVYHAYSEYLALPLDADDGHVFIRSLGGPLRKVTDGLPVENAVNPHVSPDGSRVTFTAIPQGVIPPGTARNYGSLGQYLEIYVYDLARDSLLRLTSNSVADEDGKFSPDGQQVVFKHAGQIWVMSANGSGASQLTTSGHEKSGPNYSPDGASIAYWDGDGSQADIWRMRSGGGGATQLVGTGGLQEYYPIYRDAQTILFSRWESTSDRHDKVYAYSLALGATQRLPLNLTGVEDADPFPVDAGLIGLSSTRGGGSYDLYVANPSTGAVYPVGTANGVLQELGGCYSPYENARAVAMVSPGAAVQLMGGNTVVVKARAYSNGGIWTGAAPKMILQGPVYAEFAGLYDDGTAGDQTAGDGIYSAAVTLPPQAGTYLAHASAMSSDNGIAQELRSASVLVTLAQQLPAPIVSAATAVTGTGFTANWSGVGGATGYRLDVSTDIAFSSYVSGYQDLDVGNVTGKEVIISSASPSHYYRVRAYNGIGTGVNSGAMSVATVTAVAQIGSGGSAQYRLDQNFPNPFHPLTSIEFAIPRPAFTSLRIYSALGVLVETLVGHELPAGRYRVRWDGSRHPSGTYFYRLQSGEFTETRKLILIK